MPAGDFRMLLDEASASGRFAPLDRATSAVIDWPGGNSAYLYGAYFHQYLAERFGAETLTRLSRRHGRTPAVLRVWCVQERLRTIARANCGATSRATPRSGFWIVRNRGTHTADQSRLYRHGSGLQPRTAGCSIPSPIRTAFLADGAAPGRNVANGGVPVPRQPAGRSRVACSSSISSSSMATFRLFSDLYARPSMGVTRASDAAARGPPIRMSPPTDGPRLHRPAARTPHARDTGDPDSGRDRSTADAGGRGRHRVHVAAVVARLETRSRPNAAASVVHRRSSSSTLRPAASAR